MGERLYVRRLSVRLLGGIVAITLIVVVFGFFKLRHNKPLSNPFPPSIRRAAGVQLYFPTHLPHGYDIDAASIEQPSKGVTVITVANTASRKIYLSQQALPGSFKVNQFNQNFHDSQRYSLPLGQVVVGKLTDLGQPQYIASIITNDKAHSWILCNTTQNVSLDDLKQVIASLRSY